MVVNLRGWCERRGRMREARETAYDDAAPQFRGAASLLCVVFGRGLLVPPDVERLQDRVEVGVQVVVPVVVERVGPVAPGVAILQADCDRAVAVPGGGAA